MKIFLTFAATTALWAALAAGLVHWNVLYVLTRSDVTALEEAYADLYNKGYQMFLLWDKCKNST